MQSNASLHTEYTSRLDAATQQLRSRLQQLELDLRTELHRAEEQLEDEVREQKGSGTPGQPGGAGIRGRVEGRGSGIHTHQGETEEQGSRSLEVRRLERSGLRGLQRKQRPKLIYGRRDSGAPWERGEVRCRGHHRGGRKRNSDAQRETREPGSPERNRESGTSGDRDAGAR